MPLHEPSFVTKSKLNPLSNANREGAETGGVQMVLESKKLQAAHLNVKRDFDQPVE